jgi:hypothetical protein
MISVQIHTRLKATTDADVDHIADFLYISKKVTKVLKLFFMLWWRQTVKIKHAFPGNWRDEFQFLCLWFVVLSVTRRRCIT